MSQFQSQSLADLDQTSSPQQTDSGTHAVASHASHSSAVTPTQAASGIPIRCQFCPGQRFRRSRLRAADIKQLLLMRYPVRCLFCSQRQMVSFTVAGVSLPSHVSQPKNRKRSRKE